MKKVIFLLSLALPFSNVSLANSFDQAACTMFMCATQEDAGGDCVGAIKQLKSIQKFSKHHHHWYFDCAGTTAKRQARMLACREAPADMVRKTAQNFGCKR